MKIYCELFLNHILGECQGSKCTVPSLLEIGQYIVSPNGVNKLIFQGDGNLVIYCREKAIWSTGTYNQPIKHMFFQVDGNIELLRNNSVVAFRSPAALGQGKELKIQDDGNLVIYSANGNALWNTRSYGKCPTGIKT